jgi:hypothetical protein
MKLLTTENYKTSKGTAFGYITGILYLLPSDLSGKQLCPNATPGCIASCLNTAGRGAFNSVQTARNKKTQWLISNRASFIDQLRKDIKALERKASRLGLKPCVRLNGTSDLPWENLAPELMTEFSHVQFYDYTKSKLRMLKFLNNGMPSNYHLTFSRAENNEQTCEEIISLGGNVAAVFKRADQISHQVSKGYFVDGDRHDLRFLDTPGKVIALVAKGRARKDSTGFVIGRATA